MNSRVRQGNAFTAKTRKVCAKCNNGWMSILEGRAKPILMPLFRAELFTLDAEAQSILAGWIAKTRMAADTLFAESSAISPAERTWVMTTGRAPDSWQIWLARHTNAEWETALDHVGLALHRAADHERSKNEINTQSTTIGIGKLLIHTFSSAIPTVEFDPSAEFGPRLRRLWPPRPKKLLFWPIHGGEMSWPPGHSLSDEEVERLGRHLYAHYTPSTRLAGE